MTFLPFLFHFFFSFFSMAVSNALLSSDRLPP